MIGPLVHSSLIRRGAAPTVIGPDGRELTGIELHTAASRLAAALVAGGVRPGQVAAIAFPRSIEQVAALVAALYVGADFVFADPEAPPARTARLLELVNPACVVGTGDPPPDHLAKLGLKHLPLDLLAGGDQGAPFEPSFTPSGYCVQTSGTTGLPKVLRIDGRALEARLRWGQSVYSLSLDDTVLSTSSPGFDFYVWELLAPLCFGARLVLTSSLEAASATALLGRCASEKVTAVHFFPRLLGEFSELAEGSSAVATLRWVFSGGAPLLADTLGKARSAMPDAVLLNQYGPAECCIDVSYLDCNSWWHEGRGGMVPIGRPIDNTTLRVVDPMLRTVPPGTVGEILIGGIAASTTRVISGEGGQRSFLTLERDGTPEAVYRTGDFGYVDNTGLLHFTGRRDGQFKIHGTRVDLSEVAAAVRKIDGVTDCYAYPTESRDGDVALGVVIESATSTRTECRRQLASALPLSMIPTKIDVVASLPRTPKLEIDVPSLIGRLGLRPVDRDPTGGPAPHPAGENGARTVRTAPGAAKIRPTSAQEQRLIAMRNAEGRPPYLIVANHLRIRGALDPQRLADAFHELVARHPVLRTTYASYEGQLMAMVHDLPALDVFEVRSMPGVRDEAAIRSFIQEEYERERQRFADPDRHSMIRAIVYRYADDLASLLLMIDHIVIDERSKGMLQRELAVLYERGAGALAPAVPYDPLRIRADFPPVREVPALVASASPLPPRILPSPDPVADPTAFHAGTFEIELDRVLSCGVGSVVRRLKCTRFELLLAMFFRALKRYSGTDDIALVTPADTRSTAEDFETVGFFQNLVLLRSRVAADASLEAAVDDCKDTVRHALAYRDHPIDEVIEEFRDRSVTENRRNPIWQIALYYSADDVDGNWRLAGLDVVDVPMELRDIGLELQLDVAETPEGIKAKLHFATGSLDRDEAARIASLWTEALHWALDGVGVGVGSA